MLPDYRLDDRKGALALVFLAMAYYRIGDEKKAQDLLKKSRVVIRFWDPTTIGDATWHPFPRDVLQLALNEAEALIAPEKTNSSDLSLRTTEDRPQDRFVGTWSNMDGGTQSHLTFNIFKQGEQFQVRVLFKSTPPTWSQPVRFHLLGSNVGAQALPYGFASWDHGFAELYITAHIEEEQLVIESYKIFKDNSGRSNYRLWEVFERSYKQLSMPPTAQRPKFDKASATTAP